MSKQLRRLIDLRSDTITTPSKGMYQAIINAKLGDDGFDDEPTTKLMQRKVSEMFQKEAALFVPSGTMGNLISMLTLCQRGQKVILGDNSHLYLTEQGGVSSIAGIFPHGVPNLPDGRLNLESVRAAILPVVDWHSETKVISFENTHNSCGGKVIGLEHMQELRQICDQFQLKLHLDGSRIFNAWYYLSLSNPEIQLHELARDCDTLNLCFSKGMGCPVGSVILGNQEFISRAKRWRRALGGSMRQSGLLTSAAIYALDRYPEVVKSDYEKAQFLYQGLKELGYNLEQPQSNIINIWLSGNQDAGDFNRRLRENQVLALARMNRYIRLVTHQCIEYDELKSALEVFDQLRQPTQNLCSNKMYRAIPVSSKILSRKWKEYNQNKHLENLKQVKGLVTTSSPQSFKHLRNKAKKAQIIEDRFTEIERENRILLEKMTSIMQKRSKTNSPGFRHRPKSLNRIQRKQQLIQITQENQALLRRLQQKQPIYKSRNWLQDRQQTEKRLKNICEFPYLLNVSQSFRKTVKTPKKNTSFQRKPKQPLVVYKGSKSIKGKYFVIVITKKARFYKLSAYDTKSSNNYHLKVSENQVENLIGKGQRISNIVNFLEFQDEDLLLVDSPQDTIQSSRLPNSRESRTDSPSFNSYIVQQNQFKFDKMSNRPGSAPSNKMTVIQQRRTTRPNSQNKPRPIKKQLQPSNRLQQSQTSTREWVSTATKINDEERQRLNIITSKPKLFEKRNDELQEKAIEMRRILQEREEMKNLMNNRLESLKKQYNIQDNETTQQSSDIPDEEQTESFEEEPDFDYSQYENTQKQYANFDEKLTKRNAQMQQLTDFAKYVHEKVDEEGNKFVEFPQDYDELLDLATENAISLKEIGQDYTEDPTKWIEIYDDTVQDEYQTQRSKIRQLDRKLAKVESNQRALERTIYSRNSNNTSVIDQDSVFITKFQPKANKKRPSSNTSTRSKASIQSDIILRNIETASSYKGHYSLIAKLPKSEKQKLAVLTGELPAIEENSGILTEDQEERMSQINSQLRRYVPQNLWEMRSLSDAKEDVSSYLSMSKGKFNLKSEKQPGESVLKEQKQNRELQEKLAKINSGLQKVYTKEISKPNAEILNQLLLEATVECGDLQTKSIMSEEATALFKAKQIVQKLEKDDLNQTDTQDILNELDQNIQNYERLIEDQQDPDKNENLRNLRDITQAYTQQCSQMQGEINDVLGKLEMLEGNITKEIVYIQQQDDSFEDYPIQTIQIREQSIEDIDKEIENKIQQDYDINQPQFDYFQQLNADNFPLLHEAFQNASIQEEYDFDNDPDYQELLEAYTCYNPDEEI